MGAHGARQAVGGLNLARRGFGWPDADLWLQLGKGRLQSGGGSAGAIQVACSGSVLGSRVGALSSCQQVDAG